VFDGAPGNGNGDRLRTRDVASWLDKVGDTGSTLFVTAQLDELLGRALGNLPDVELRTPSTLRLDDLLSFDTLLVARPALDALSTRATVKG
jgi:ribosomal protein L4